MTTTVNYSWALPTVGASVNTWGTLVNNILIDIDAKMVSKTDAQTLTNKTLAAPVITGGASISGNVSVTGTGAFSSTLYMPQNNLLQWNSTGASGGTNRAVIWGDSSGNLNFGNGPSNATSATLDAVGNLLVGTTSASWSSAGRGLIEVNGGSTALIGLKTGGTQRAYFYHTGGETVLDSLTGGITLQTTGGTARLDTSGNLLVGTTTSSGRLSIKASGTATYAAAFYDSANTFLSGFYVGASGINGGYNGANCVQWITKDATTSRSINAGGTINASGADYAEYERNNGTKFAKGQVVGFKEDGTLTDVYADAIRFGVKSTNPGLVGGDAWGTDKQVGKRPDEPYFADPEYKGPQDPGTAPIEPVQQTLPEDANDEDKTKASEDFATAHAAWVAASADHEKLAYEYHAAQVDHAARVEVAKQLFDTDTYPEYQRALAAFEARVEAERQTVDRIAYCGKVPVAVYGATPGGYIIADKDSDGKIIGKFIADPDFAQYKKAVGRVNRVMDEAASDHLVEAINGADPTQFIGMAEIAVIVH